MEKILEMLKQFWTFISTPGTKLPTKTTFIVLVVIVLFAFLLPAFTQWRAYRRENPLPSPKEKLKGKNASQAKSSGKKKKSGKKKHS